MDIKVLLHSSGALISPACLPRPGRERHTARQEKKGRLQERGTVSLPLALPVASLTPADGRGGSGQARTQEMKVQMSADTKLPVRTPWLTQSLLVCDQEQFFSHICTFLVPLPSPSKRKSKEEMPAKM